MKRRHHDLDIGLDSTTLGRASCIGDNYIMTKGVFRDQIISWLLKANRYQRQGFTLIELLVSIIVGSIIVSALLFLVTELNRFNGREELLTQTQQNMRRALDFMSSDVSEAIYVYTDPVPVADQLDDAPAGAEPVLAFWRLDPVDTNGLTCTTANQAECETLLVRQSAYTLVVYFHTNNDNNSIWEGESRIIRYQLPKYGSGNNDIRNLNQRDGYLDPSLEETTFADWSKQSGETTNGDSQVLTDLVSLYDNSISDEDSVDCPDASFDSRTPTQSNSFYACVRSGDTTDAVAGFNEELLNRTNQSVFIALTGNAARGENDVLVGAANNASVLPTLEAEVLIRGVIEKPKD